MILANGPDTPTGKWRLISTAFEDPAAAGAAVGWLAELLVGAGGDGAVVVEHAASMSARAPDATAGISVCSVGMFCTSLCRPKEYRSSARWASLDAIVNCFAITEVVDASTRARSSERSRP